MSHENRRVPITTLLLQKYYQSVVDLQTYVLSIVDVPAICNEGDNESYMAFVKNTVVATNLAIGKEPRFIVQDVNYDMGEVVQQAQKTISKRTGDASKNVLALGCTSRYQAKGYVIKNTIALAFQSEEWSLLLTRIGVDAMYEMLTAMAIFIPLPNGCLCQVAGEALVLSAPPSALQQSAPALTSSGTAAKRKASELEAEPITTPPYKRRKLARVGPCLSPQGTYYQTSPAGLLLSRVRLMYARPNLIPHTNSLVVGLPVSHVLNRFHPAYSKTRSERPEHIPSKQAADARHLSKYIFPGQYGLQTPFQSLPAKKEAFSYLDYLDREKEISGLGSCKTPKRLREILALLDQMIWRHKKCSYKALRDVTCSSKIPTEGGKRLDNSVILELVSETSIQLPTQPSLRLNEISFDSAGNPISPGGGTQANAHAQNKPRFVEFACSHTEVFRFVALVTKAVIPMAMWGNKSNFYHILKAVKRYITCRRYESVTLHYILQGFSTAACDWLAPPSESAQAQKRVSVSDSLKRRELLEEFIFWYFDGFVTPLLKTTFYITESSALRNQVLYFRQDDWRTLCAPLIERLADGMFERIPDKDVQEILLQRSLGFSFVRLLPKETGVRPIVNLRKKKPMGGMKDRSINQVLAVAFQVLSYEKTNSIDKLGASVFGADQVYTRLREFKSRIGKKHGALPQLYFVKVDVQACFDSIDQPRLLEILKQLISRDVYIAEKYGQVHFSQNRIKRTFPKNAVPKGHEADFVERARELAGVLRNVIFVDQPGYPVATKEAVLKLLEEHITENMVKIGKNYYRQKVGIPQGSVLSAILCSFFYGDLERRRMRFTNDKGSVLMRLIDDYLFITTSLEKAKGFLDMMNQGHPEYGCFIAKEKTLTNFDYGPELSNSVDPRSKVFPWCGWLLNMKDLSVAVDYTRYGSRGIKNTLTVDRGRALGAAFKHKMLQFAHARNHALYSDAWLNSEDTVYLNIYQNFVLSAYKMQEYIRDGGLKLSRNSSFIYKTIQQSIEASYASLLAQGMRKFSASDAPRKLLHVKKLAVFWLGTHAFHHILAKKPYGYEIVLRNLEKQQGKLCNRFYKRRFKRLVKEGHTAFAFLL